MSEKEPTEREKIEAAKTYKEILRNKELYIMHVQLTQKMNNAMRKIYGGCFKRNDTLSRLLPNGSYYSVPELIGRVLEDLAEAKGVELTIEDYLSETQ